MAETISAIHALPRPAWLDDALGDAAGRGVRVAVVDSGRDPRLRDARVLAGLGLVDGGYGLGLEPSDDDHDRIGHGAACTEILLGMAPGIEVVPVRVFGARLESSPAVIVEAIDRALAAGARVINLSLGHLIDRAARPLFHACERAREHGAVVVAAVHPETGWSYPANFANTLGVAAARWRDPFDLEVDPEAGAECRALGERRVDWLGTRRRVVGTSFAAPHVAALVALVLERHPASDLDQVREHLARLARRGGTVDRLEEAAPGPSPFPVGERSPRGLRCNTAPEFHER